MRLAEFIEELKKRDIDPDERMIARFNTYADYLQEYNEKVNLTAITEYEEVLDKHFYDSLLAARGQPEGSLADVGTGAGFPGVVLKIAYPGLQVVLIEPLHKRCVFLESLIEKLDLQGIEVVNARGEDHALSHREAYDYVTARAVSNLPALLEICGAMVKVGGYFIAMRGKDGHKELETAQKAIRTMGFVIEEVRDEELYGGDKRVIAYLKKVTKTPLKYPRKYNIIKKNLL